MSQMALQIRLLRLQILNLIGGALITSLFAKTEQWSKSVMSHPKEPKASVGPLHRPSGLLD